MTVANWITIARILMVPLFVVELLNYTASGYEAHRWVAIALFAIAAVGDGVDGYVARRFRQRTDLGALLDPVADKLLLVLSLVILTLDNRPQLDRIPVWLTATVLLRDVVLLLLFVLINSLIGRGTVRPHLIGKIATVLQMICVLWALLKLDPKCLVAWAAGAAACTGVSGVIYTRAGIRMLRGGGTQRHSPPPGGGSA